MKEICRIDQLVEGKGKRFIIDDTDIAIFMLEGKVYALSNICPHQHSAIIYDGFLEDNCVVCPAHGWKFNLSNGKKNNGYNGLKSYPILIENGKVYIELIKNKFNW